MLRKIAEKFVLNKRIKAMKVLPLARILCQHNVRPCVRPSVRPFVLLSVRIFPALLCQLIITACCGGDSIFKACSQVPARLECLFRFSFLFSYSLSLWFAFSYSLSFSLGGSHFCFDPRLFYPRQAWLLANFCSIDFAEHVVSINIFIQFEYDVCSGSTSILDAIYQSPL